MPSTPRKSPHGLVAIAGEASAPVDEHEAREQASIADVEERVASGALSAEDADRELLEMVLRERFAFLAPDALEELRMVGLELLEEPEIVETRNFYYEASPGDDER